MNAPGERQDVAITDAGRKAADAINLHRVAGGVGRWVAIRLSDGGSDGRAYDTKADAVRNQLHETQCAYTNVPPAPATPAEMTAWIDMHRRMYDANMRLHEPDAPQLVMPTAPGRRPRLAHRIHRDGRNGGGRRRWG